MNSRLFLTLALSVAASGATIDFAGEYSQPLKLAAGQIVEISVGLPEPSTVPVNGRVAVEWAGYRKVLHALDPDFYMLWRAPKTGSYVLKAVKVEDEDAFGNGMNAIMHGTAMPIAVLLSLHLVKSCCICGWSCPCVPSCSIEGTLCNSHTRYP